GMPLQIDATVQYALGRPHANLSLQDLKVKSPYNTYLHKGLPPGPIDNPSLSSIKAAAHPAKTDYLYYVLEKNGKRHYFTSSYQKFLRAKAAAGR
ncbi:MAG: endolytic transglycosylase MltG, partial [Rubrobacteraceae bacterium]|nr:endolytic transglycosylase MltG [Rubrobacteraceae bacterium]